ncbi:MAG TPA: hypothetical protein VFE06_16715 [Acidobacteriaceae bacterium]|jgi:hypothetical protein|nr:hypothetical protein [Acidobacteriaceae bacterium]
MALAALCSAQRLSAQETIIALRHAEKPAAGLGQLTCRGLNRALALPGVLIPRFGKPDAIYAPDPAVEVSDRSNTLYSYVRPLITIEPTAIELGMPVNAQIGYNDIAKLQAELTSPAFANARIFVAWEHGFLNRFAVQMLASFGEDPAKVPDWPNDDYDRIYVFTIQQGRGKPSLQFKIEHEDLNHSLSDTCPGSAR